MNFVSKLNAAVDRNESLLCVGLDPVSVGGVAHHRDRRASAVADEVGVAGVVRRGKDHLVAGFDQQGEDQQHGGRGARGDDHLFGIDGDAAAAALVDGDGLPQLRQPRLSV